MKVCNLLLILKQAANNALNIFFEAFKVLSMTFQDTNNKTNALPLV